eukprot:TRINITY_DN1328_c0_g1_i1.p1 TRINITY_DN1328_c0_g1~~TRINITY_DN1328_c0_g1_i1.p1  ORF type:complete len:414 (-),score=8.15 TRINITY_DN1328_c0_g1_i1:44-1210(-)
MANVDRQPDDSFTQFLASLDYGPVTCQFKDLLIQLGSRHQSIDPRTLFDLSDETFPDVLDIVELRRQFDELAPIVRQHAIRASVVKFVHWTNAIEFVAPESEADTDSIIFGSRPHHSPQSTAVVNTYEQMKSLYAPSALDSNEPHSYLVLDVPKLIHIHSLLSDCKSEFRTAGVKSKNMAGAEHVYPHHTVVPDAVESLNLLVFYLLKAGASLFPAGSSSRIMVAFAIAAFYQYHFVSIHPFSDGNGRMCRLLSKLILDWVIPLPIPMFEIRDDYLCAIDAGRIQDLPRDAHVPLLKLLLRTARQHLIQVLANCNNLPPLVLCARKSTDIPKKITDYIELQFLSQYPEAIALLQSTFDSMIDGEDRVINIRDSAIRIVRWPTIDFDSI